MASNFLGTCTIYGCSMFVCRGTHLLRSKTMIYTIYKTEYWASQLEADTEEEVEAVLKVAPGAFAWERLESETEIGEFPNEDANESY